MNIKILIVKIVMRSLISVLLASFFIGTTLSAQEKTIPEERQLPRLVDKADLLTEEEEMTLLTLLDEISERQRFDVVIVAVDSLNGKTPMEFADDFYDYNGYGYGADDDGILLLVSMSDRDWWISTHAYGIIAFTDAGQKYISEQFLPYLSSGIYDAAFTEFANLCDKFITQARTGEPYDEGNLPASKWWKFWLIINLVIAFPLAFYAAKQKAKKLKSIVRKESANLYVVSGSLNLFKRLDKQYNIKVISHTISKSRSGSSSSGGSSTHISSSGRTHGGSGGKF